jgi:hypothetical protein
MSRPRIFRAIVMVAVTAASITGLGVAATGSALAAPTARATAHATAASRHIAGLPAGATPAPVHGFKPLSLSPADSSSNYLCADFVGGAVNLNDCVNPSSSTFSSGETINVGSANYGINPLTLCTVGFESGECTPFSPGSDCNSVYKGFTVFLLEWNANKSYFMRNEHTDSDQVLISSTDDIATEYLYAELNGVDFLVNVTATNDAGVTCTSSNLGVVLTYRPNTGTVFDEPFGSYAGWKQSWSFTGF